MDILGHVYPDADCPQHHLHAARAYVGRAHLLTHHFFSPDDSPEPDNAMHSVMLSVPPSMHRRVVEDRPSLRAVTVLVPWAKTSGIGILVVDAGGMDAVLAVLDIAGRTDLEQLNVAARDGRVTAGIASDADPNVTPLVPVSGFADALSDARSLRRLAAREFVESVAAVRSILRGPGGPALLCKFPPRLETLTVLTCPM